MIRLELESGEETAFGRIESIDWISFGWGVLHDGRPLWSGVESARTELWLGVRRD